MLLDKTVSTTSQWRRDASIGNCVGLVGKEFRMNLWTKIFEQIFETIFRMKYMVDFV